MQSEILSIEENAWENHINGKPQVWAEISSEDVSYIDPNLVKPVSGKEELREYLDGTEAPVAGSGPDFSHSLVRGVGNAAILTYICELNTGNGRVAPWNITRVYYKPAGEWKLVHSHLSVVNHHQPALVEIPLPVTCSPVEYTGLLAEVMQPELQAMERWRQGDPWGFIENSAEDVTYCDTGTPQRIDGRNALAEVYKLREGKIHYEVMDFIDPCIQSCGDLAVLYYRFLSIRLQPDGSIKSRTAWNCTEVLSRINGAWKTRHNHWSLIMGIPDVGE